MATKRTIPQLAVNGRADPPLTPKQEAAALSLASGDTIGQAARKSGAGARTIRTWLADLPAFKRRVSELRSEMTDRALGVLTDTMADAASTLRKLLKAKSEQTRMLVARAILELAPKLRETTELEERLRALEENQRRAAR